MYLWQIHKLKTELKAGPMSPSRLLPYMIALGILLALAAYSPWLLDVPPANQWDYANLAVAILSLVVGLMAAFRANKGSAGQDFGPRVLSIGWVLGWRLLPALSVIVFVTMLLDPVQRNDANAPTTAVGFMSLSLYQLVFYWRLTSHVGDVARSTSLSTGSAA